MINKFVDKISVFLKRTFCCFSLITVAMSLIGMLINTDVHSKYISVEVIMSFFLFSLLLALSFGIADLIRNNSILRRFAQFLLTYLSVVAVFFVGGAFSNYVEANGVQNKAFSILAISFVFVIIYVLCGLVVLLCGVLKSKLENKNKEYKGIFENKE